VRLRARSRGADALIRIALLTSRVRECGKSRGEGCRPHPPPATTLRFRSPALSYSYTLSLVRASIGLGPYSQVCVP
jgi:hypothetical protein